MESNLPERSVAMRLVAGEEHYEQVISAVLGAQCSVWIATANLKDLMVESDQAGLRRLGRKSSHRPILEMLDDLTEKKVELRILHSGVPSRSFRETFDKHPRLISGGLQLRLCPRMHMKLVIVDGEFLYLGSANWTGAGLGAKASTRRNFELGIITRDPRLLDEVQAMYERIWQGTECKACKRRDVCEDPLDG
ncbi:MAG: phospholipase D family protein [Pseudomonadota bacterium]